MWKLLPESWRQKQQAEGCCHSQRLVTSLALWTECYATLVAVLSVRHPDKTPHLMAYLRTITRASRNFEGVAWVSYDMAFRRQAATGRSLDWAVIDTALCNEAFTGRARAIPRSSFCLADSHESKDCVLLRRSGQAHHEPRTPHMQQAAGRHPIGWISASCSIKPLENVQVPTVPVCSCLWEVPPRRAPGVGLRAAGEDQSASIPVPGAKTGEVNTYSVGILELHLEDYSADTMYI